MRAGRAGAALLAGALLLVALGSSAEAQRPGGGGKGRHRGGGAEREKSAQEALGPGEYALDGAAAHEAINRGEGSQALAYYERVGEEAGRDGSQARAARAWHAATVTALRLGRFQKVIQDGGRAIEMFKAAGGLTPSDLGSWASVHAQLGSAYRAVGDLPRARATLEEGVALARTRLSGRREDQAEGYLLNGLAQVAYAQRDYPAALARSTQAAQFFEGVESGLPPKGQEHLRTKLRRWNAASLAMVGRAQLALGHPDEADQAFDRGLRYARLTGLRDTEADMLAGQGSLALARQDWPRALGIYQQAIVLATQVKRLGRLPGLYQGQARALSGLGRTEEAFAASREAVRSIEELRADLGDSSLRTGFFEDKQAIYQHAVALALRAGHPEDAFVMAEQGRSRTFLDLLGSQTTLSKGRTRALVDEEVRLRARLAEARADAEDVDGSADSERARGQAETLERDYRAFLERVRKDNLEQASLMAVEPVTRPEIQRLLPAGTTLLEYQVGEGGAVVWIVERERFAMVRLPGDRSSLLAQVRRFRAAITGQAPLVEVEQQARALHRRLLEPARAEIHGDRLVIVPHGILHYLPFAALRSPAGRWLVEDFALSTLPSASVMRYLVDKGAGASAR
ncbi:MAG TPA: CHAT domain-containing protein, partial [Methylomirabilota bacterium]|nr:CHAT domain-containing protein [Methylomirabilota bacterium]